MKNLKKFLLLFISAVISNCQWNLGGSWNLNYLNSSVCCALAWPILNVTQNSSGLNFIMNYSGNGSSCLTPGISGLTINYSTQGFVGITAYGIPNIVYNPTNTSLGLSGVSVIYFPHNDTITMAFSDCGYGFTRASSVNSYLQGSTMNISVYESNKWNLIGGSLCCDPAANSIQFITNSTTNGTFEYASLVIPFSSNNPYCMYCNLNNTVLNFTVPFQGGAFIGSEMSGFYYSQNNTLALSYCGCIIYFNASSLLAVGLMILTNLLIIF